LADSNDRINETKESWLKSATLQTGFSRERVIELLQEKFQKFHIGKAPEMMMFLMDVRDHEETQAMLEKQDRLKQVPDCPICGALAIRDTRWDGRHTKTKGWTCTKGGLDHWMQWRANNIRRKQGLDILYPEVNRDDSTSDPEKLPA